MSDAFLTAAAAGLLHCHECGLLVRASDPQEAQTCDRCDHPLRFRKIRSLQRTAALLLAAAICYIPANLLPVMHTSIPGQDEDDTILSGVVALWTAGSWPLALLVFLASIIIPLVKLMSLSLLVWSGHRRSNWRVFELARLYRFIEFIGRWSMMDVFVVALLGALVQLRGLATIHGKLGIMAFAAVVVLTMWASRSFDPRLLWDGQRR